MYCMELVVPVACVWELEEIDELFTSTPRLLNKIIMHRSYFATERGPFRGDFRVSLFLEIYNALLI